MRKMQMWRHLISVMYDWSPTPARAQLLVEELLIESQSLRTRITTVQCRLLHFTLNKSDKLWSGAFMSFCVEMYLQTQMCSPSASIESTC